MVPDALLPSAVLLRGRTVQLAPTSIDDAPGLYAALDDAEVWRWIPTPRPADLAGMLTIVSQAISDLGERFPWTVRLADGEVVGWSSYLDIAPTSARIEIGNTQYGRASWRTAVNTETKLLLLGHAFETLGNQRVCLKTDIRNERSQQAIERIGGVREGVLRRHRRRADGSLRDTVYYSILADEWPEVRARLQERGEPGR